MDSQLFIPGNAFKADNVQFIYGMMTFPLITQLLFGAGDIFVLGLLASGMYVVLCLLHQNNLTPGGHWPGWPPQ